MTKNQKYLKNRNKNNRRFLLSVFLLLALAFFTFRTLNASMRSEITSLEKQISEKNSQIEDIQADIANIQEDYKMRNTDEFKEKIARERLNMLKKDEYVYKDGNNK